MRIKVYDKLLASLQSESVKKGVGMNTSAIYYPSMHMQKTIREFQHDSITRVEISYYADSVEAEGMLISDAFVEQANNDINIVQYVLDATEGITHKLGIMGLLSSF